jgi:sugar lactone lactonase YvrE
LVPSPSAVAVDAAGNVFVADTHFNRIRKISTFGTITTVAGTGDVGYTGDGDLAVNASLDQPHGVAVDSAGDIFIADTNNNALREVTPDGIINTIAGDGTTAGSGGDGQPAVDSSIFGPWGIVVDSAGALFIAEFRAGGCGQLPPER